MVLSTAILAVELKTKYTKPRKLIADLDELLAASPRELVGVERIFCVVLRQRAQVEGFTFDDDTIRGILPDELMEEYERQLIMDVPPSVA
jgi:hypothetical protein